MYKTWRYKSNPHRSSFPFHTRLLLLFLLNSYTSVPSPKISVALATRCPGTQLDRSCSWASLLLWGPGVPFIFKTAPRVSNCYEEPHFHLSGQPHPEVQTNHQESNPHKSTSSNLCTSNLLYAAACFGQTFWQSSSTDKMQAQRKNAIEEVIYSRG